tara:strand:+ start:535 stop:801 length:267 start_codon:yes stop_codon:yes gene_type:complete
MNYFTLGSFTLSTNKSIPTQEEIDKKNVKENKNLTLESYPTQKGTTITIDKDIKKGEKIQISRFIKTDEDDDGHKYKKSSYAVTLITN